MVIDAVWRAAPDRLTLHAQAVHVWLIELEQSPAVVQQLNQRLSVDEQQRAGRFYFPVDRRRFTVARGALRMILGCYLGQPPAQVRLAYGPRGKPELAELPAKASLCFNLSHSRDRALCAVTPGRAVGVDLEHLRPVAQAEQLAAQVFSRREQAIFHKLPEAQRQLAFFNAWTRKEAYLKAVGAGLTDALDQIEVTLAPDAPARLLNVFGRPGEAERWSVRALDTGTGYAAAVVIEGQQWDLACWRWDQRCLAAVEA